MFNLTTDTPTPSPTRTPTPTPIICGSGVTTGNYYYTDCCNNIVSGADIGTIVTFDYTKPFNGLTKLNVTFSTVCQTPTPTLTPSLTQTPQFSPTPSPTTTLTPTITQTQTSTPTSSGIYRLKNSCDVFTLFDMGVICNPLKQPSTANSYDGILSLKVTGGTSPYSYFWEGGQRTQTLSSIKAGSYEVIVIDYYGDYTASTVCSLFAPSPTPTSSPTPTPTTTPPTECYPLCLFAADISTAIGPLQFECDGYYNEKIRWFNGQYYIIWKPTQNRWEVVESDLNTPVVFGPGVMVSTSSADIPLSSWNFVGGLGVPPPITVIEGACPLTLPLMAFVSVSNNNCSGSQNCDGSISFTAKYGTPPYVYSINNGNTYQTGSIFNGLCPGTYTTIVKDSVNSTYINTVVIEAASTNTTYTVSVVSTGTNNNTLNNNADSLSTFEVVVSPPIPTGTTINFNLNIETLVKNMGPWFTNEPNLTASFAYIPQLFKNSVDITSQLTSQVPGVTLSPRPDCNPSQMATIDGGYNVNLTIGANDKITGSIYCQLNELNPVIQNSCVSTITSQIDVSATNSIINGCSCCNVVNNPTPAKYNLELIGSTTNTVPTLTGLYLASNEIDACAGNGIPLTNGAYTFVGTETYCNYTTILSTETSSLSNGTYYVSDGVNVRSWIKASTPSALFNPSVCSNCAPNLPIDVYLVYRLVSLPPFTYELRFTLSNVSGSDSPVNQTSLPFNVGTLASQSIYYNATCNGSDASSTWYLLSGNFTTTKTVICPPPIGFSLTAVYLDPPFFFNIGGGYYEYNYLGQPYRIYITPAI